MKIKTTRAIFIDGAYVEKDKVVDVPDKDGVYLIGRGKAVSTEKKKKPE